MTRSVVFSIQDSNTVAPDFLYLDTNSLAEMAINRIHNIPISNFIVSAAGNGTMVLLSQHTKNELKDTIHAEVMKEQAQLTGFTGNPNLNQPVWKQYENTGVNHGAIVLSKYGQMLALLQSLAPHSLIELETPPQYTWELRTNAFVELGIAPKDARHAAIMHYHGSNDVLTLDAGYYRVPDLNIYAPNPGLTRYVIQNSTALPYNPIIP